MIFFALEKDARNLKRFGIYYDLIEVMINGRESDGSDEPVICASFCTKRESEYRDE